MLARQAVSHRDWFWSDVDPRVRGLLARAEKPAQSAVVKPGARQSFPADIRISFAGFFLVIVLGKERRDGARSTAEQRAKPVLSLRNLLVIAVVFGSITYAALSFASYLLRF